MIEGDFARINGRWTYSQARTISGLACFSTVDSNRSHQATIFSNRLLLLSVNKVETLVPHWHYLPRELCICEFFFSLFFFLIVLKSVIRFNNICMRNTVKKLKSQIIARIIIYIKTNVNLQSALLFLDVNLGSTYFSKFCACAELSPA